jgi:hypothetical protein
MTIFDSDTPTEYQDNPWSCSVRTVLWMLRSVGRQTSYEWLSEQMLGRVLVTQQDGLSDGSGVALANWVEQEYGYTTHARWKSFDEVREVAGKCPVGIGGRAMYHWMGVRGYSPDSDVLLLANPAYREGQAHPPYKGVRQTLDRQQFAELGPWACFWFETDEKAPSDQPTDVSTQTLEAQIADLMAKLETKRIVISHLVGEVADALDQVRGSIILPEPDPTQNDLQQRVEYLEAITLQAQREIGNVVDELRRHAPEAEQVVEQAPAGEYRVTEAGVRLRREPGTALPPLIEDLGRGTVVIAVDNDVLEADGHRWRHVRAPDGQIGYVVAEYLAAVGTDAGEALSNDADQAFGFETLWPFIQASARKYGADPQVLAAMVAQESGFTNWRVHRDGTGHGLIGLDDNGLLPDFERWSGLSCGRGDNAISIPPGPQLNYCAKIVADLTRQYGSAYKAARVWHRGAGLWDDHLGALYESLIRGHVGRLFG